MRISENFIGNYPFVRIDGVRGLTHLKVVWSPEPPISPVTPQYSERGKSIPGSIAFVPSVAGLIAAGEVVKDLIK